MSTFRRDYLDQLLFNHSIVRLLGQIQEYKGKQELYKQQTPEILGALKQAAVIQSTESSNRIEGIYATDKRISELVKLKSAPMNRSEAKIAGYRDVLETIHSSAEHISLTPNSILQLHRDLLKLATGADGNWKQVDNYIKEILPTGAEIIRFEPTSAWQTPEAMEELVRAFKIARDKKQIHDLILIAAFILDFLCIHPFPDGNGRMARLLTLLLMYQSGYEVGRFVSLEKIIEDTKEQYYETLQLSDMGWHESQHNIIPWIEYFLTTILAAYQRFEERVGVIDKPGRGWKARRVETSVEHMLGDFSIADIQERCPGVSRPTIQRILNSLSQKEIIECIERGRNARWRKLR